MSNRNPSKKPPALRVIHGTGNPKAATLEDLNGVLETMRVARKNGIDLTVQLHVGAAVVDVTNAANTDTGAAPAIPLEQAPRFVNLDVTGKPTTGEHVAVFDRTTGLVWSRGTIAKEVDHKAAMKAAVEFKLFGQVCRAPTLQERFSINDYTKHSPALDTAHFKKESGWEWTSTIDAESPSVYAWDVNLGYGYCNRSLVSYRYSVRAVLAGQQLNLSV